MQELQPLREPQSRRVTDQDMPDGMQAQRGMGDLEEDFREVTAGFETMHERVPDRMVGDEPGDSLRREEKKGSGGSLLSFDPVPDGPADPGGVDIVDGLKLDF